MLEKEDRSPKKAKKDRTQTTIEEAVKISPLVSSTKAHLIKQTFNEAVVEGINKTANSVHRLPQTYKQIKQKLA